MSHEKLNSFLRILFYFFILCGNITISTYFTFKSLFAMDEYDNNLIYFSILFAMITIVFNTNFFCFWLYKNEMNKDKKVKYKSL